jgi:small subunit ribosomal protein S6
MFVFDPTFALEGANVDNEVQRLMQRAGGEIILSRKWEERKLAYEIKKQSKGVYILMHIAGTGKVVSEVERMLRISDDVLKYLTVAVDEKALAAAGAGAPGFQPAGAGRRQADAGDEGIGEESVAAMAAADGEQEAE